MVAEKRLLATKHLKRKKLSLLLLLFLLLLLLTTTTSVLFENQTYNREPEVSEVSELTSDDVPRPARDRRW